MSTQTAESSPAPLGVLALVDSLQAGGAELMIAEFARVAPEVGVKLMVSSLDGMAAGPAADRLRQMGVEPTTTHLRRLLDPRDHARVRRHIASIGPDLVHTHLAYADIVGGLSARRLGLPAVSTIHSNHFAEHRREQAKDRLAALVRRHCCREVIAVSAETRNSYLATGWDLPKRVVTVRNGIGAEPRPGTGIEIRRELGIGPDAPMIAMLSVLRPEKCHPVAIEAVRSLLGRFPDIRIVIAGDGSERAVVESAAAELGDAAMVLGHRDDPMAILDAADILLHSSSTEAFPTALLEAMASSVPVVATAVGGIPEIVDDGKTGVLVPPPPDPALLRAALESLLADAELRHRLGAAGRARYEMEFMGSAWARRVRLVYDAVLDG